MRTKTRNHVHCGTVRSYQGFGQRVLTADPVLNISPGRASGMKCAPVLTIVILLFASLAAVAQEPQDKSCGLSLQSNGCSDLPGLPLHRSLPGEKPPLIHVEKEVRP